MKASGESGRYLSWGLEHHGVAGHECWGNLGDSQVDGVVEGWNTEDDTQWHLYRQHHGDCSKDAANVRGCGISRL